MITKFTNKFVIKKRNWSFYKFYIRNAEYYLYKINNP